ncbi:MAG: twin-arginine translocation signal domain-containing protein, partial [Bacteroidota bacterium]
METNRRTFIKNTTYAAIGSMAAFSLTNNAWAEESPMQDGGHQHLS